jgi:hypothetical protein
MASLAAAAAQAKSGCELCGAALTDKAVVVTDWETNREHRYHDISCAVREMAARLPWSRAVTRSAASGERITLTRINITWRSQPEEAVFARIEAEGSECEKTLAFASPGEFQQYALQHKAQVPQGTRALAFEQLPEVIAAAARSQPGGEPKEKTWGRSAGAKPGPSAFSDVPIVHWAAKFVEKVRAMGLMQGYPDGTFRGDKPLTRYEMAAVLAMLADRGFFGAGEQSGGAADTTAAQAPSATGQQSAPQPQARTMPESERGGAAPSVLGSTGLLSVPSARVRGAGSLGATVGAFNRRFLASTTVGIGGGIEVGATTGRFGSEDRVFVSGKMRLERMSRPGLDVAAGVTGLGSATSAFAAATTRFQAGRYSAEATGGIGTGGVLKGVFAGAALPVKDNLTLYAETADLGDGRHFNYGLDLGLRPHVALRLGRVDGDLAAGLLITRGL